MQYPAGVAEFAFQHSPLQIYCDKIATLNIMDHKLRVCKYLCNINELPVCVGKIWPPTNKNTVTDLKMTLKKRQRGHEQRYLLQ